MGGGLPPLESLSVFVPETPTNREPSAALHPAAAAAAAHRGAHNGVIAVWLFTDGLAARTSARLQPRRLVHPSHFLLTLPPALLSAITRSPPPRHPSPPPESSRNEGVKDAATLVRLTGERLQVRPPFPAAGEAGLHGFYGRNGPLLISL